MAQAIPYVAQAVFVESYSAATIAALSMVSSIAVNACCSEAAVLRARQAAPTVQGAAIDLETTLQTGE